MFNKNICVLFLIFFLQGILTLPIGPSPYNAIPNAYSQLLPGIPPESFPGSPVITEIVPSLQFGDITVTGDLPVEGFIKVRGMFPVYGTVAVDGGLPTAGSAVVNTGCGITAQVV